MPELPAEGHRPGRDGRHICEGNGPVGYRRVLVAQRIGHERRYSQQNCYRAAPDPAAVRREFKPAGEAGIMLIVGIDILRRGDDDARRTTETMTIVAVCTENLIRVDAVMESRKLTE